MIIRNKKGVGEFTIWVIRIFALIPIVFMMVIYANSFLIDNMDVTEIEASILFQRFLYSPDGFSYIDEETLRVYPGEIDITKFNDSILFDSMTLDDNFLGTKFILEYNDQKKETYLNEDIYFKYRQYSGFGSSIENYQKNYVVKVHDENTIYDGLLKIDMVLVDG